MKSPLFVRGWKMGAEAGLNLSGGALSPPLPCSFLLPSIHSASPPFRSLSPPHHPCVCSSCLLPPLSPVRSSFAPPRIIIQSHVFLRQPGTDLLTPSVFFMEAYLVDRSLTAKPWTSMSFRAAEQLKSPSAASYLHLPGLNPSALLFFVSAYIFIH